MGRQICEVSAKNKQEALIALDMLRERIKEIPNTHSMEPVHETVEVTNEGRA